LNHSYSASSGARRSAPGSRPSYAKKGPSLQRHERGKAHAPAPRGGRAKQYINPNRFVKEAAVVEAAEFVPANSFQDFAIHPRILANVLAKGYTAPTEIQDRTIPLALEGRDVVGLAATGTGKTAAFAIPMIHDLMMHMDHRALIMAPTRELAQQIMEECLSFSKGCSLRGALLIGGASMHLQKRDLRGNPRIVVGTPGRIKDHLRQGTLLLKFFNYTVLDEVDRMLDMGFINDITSILAETNPVRQSLFFSATMEPKIERLIKGFSKDPVTVSMVQGSAADGVDQNVVYYKGNADKIEKLHELLIKPGCSKTIIFDETKRAVERLGRELNERGFKVDHIHGDKSQAQRARAIKRLKTAEIDVLVATDVAARGIDVADISHVVNYSTPNSYEDYVHRIGRTGRAGKTGCALTFLPA
jgi:superfamily II DNA/RNA helicase